MTPRRRAASAASYDAELYRLLVSSVRDYAIFALDTAGHVRTWNLGAERLKGYAANEIVGRHFSVFYPPEDVAAGKPQQGLEMVEREGRFEDEGWRVRKDGSRFWANVIITALRDEHGGLVGLTKITRDLTERRAREEQARQLAAESAARAAAEQRRVEVEQLNEQLRQQAVELETQTTEAQTLAEELEEQAIELEAANAELLGALRDAEDARAQAHRSAARYRLLFDASPMPMWVYDRATLQFLAVNDAAVKHYGYSRDEFLNMTLEEIRPPEDVPGMRQAIADMPPGLYRLAGWRHRRKDGSVIHVDIAGHRIELDGREAELTLIHDVTQRDQAKAQLRATTAVLRAVVDGAPLAIIVMDLSLLITQWNPAAERLLGWTADEIVGRSYGAIIPEEEWEEHRRLHAGVLHGETAMSVETQRRRKDGSPADVTISISALHDRYGAIRGFVVIMADDTERRRLEAQFRQAQKMEAVGQLAGGIAHDFNNLLTVIASYSGLVLSELPAEDPLRSDVQQIRGAASRAAALTRQLLAFSRQQILQPQVLALNTIVSGLEKMLRRLVREDIAIVTALAPDLGAVEADPGQVEQVIINLVVNAQDAMANGGLLTIETANAVFDAEYLRRHPETQIMPGRYVMLAVSDTGSGMTADVLARVFEPFFTTKPSGHGTGLGLSTVYGIVKQSNGYVWVYSEPGHGTTFKVYLPRVDEEPAENAGGELSGGHHIGNETVLVVEDDDALRAVACRALRQHGYQVFEARNGREAHQLCERYDGPIHLIITDMVMPEMNGGELAARMAGQHPEIRLLLMSGYTRDVVARQNIVREGSAFLDKPFTLDELADKVRRVLDSSPPSEGR